MPFPSTKPLRAAAAAPLSSVSVRFSMLGSRLDGASTAK